MNLSARRPVVVLAPDKFRGSLAASAVCASMARGLRRVWPLAEVRSCPMADGGGRDARRRAGRRRPARKSSRAYGPRRHGAEPKSLMESSTAPMDRPRSSKSLGSWELPIPSGWRRRSRRARRRASASCFARYSTPDYAVSSCILRAYRFRFGCSTEKLSREELYQLYLAFGGEAAAADIQPSYPFQPPKSPSKWRRAAPSPPRIPTFRKRRIRRNESAFAPCRSLRTSSGSFRRWPSPPRSDRLTG